MSFKITGLLCHRKSRDGESFDNSKNKVKKDPITAARSFFTSRVFMILVCFCSAVFMFTGNEVPGVVFFLMLLSFLLFFCDDVLATTMPFLALCVSVLQCYDSFNTFIKLAPLAVIPISALIYHFVKYRKKIKIGIGFYGICAVAVAVTLGGLGSIPVNEYFAPVALFYVAAIGVGMIVVYLLLRPALDEKRDYDVCEKLTDIMYIMGIIACLQIVSVYFECMMYDSRIFIDESLLGDGKYFYDGMAFSDILREFKEGGIFGFYSKYFSQRLQPGNNVSTFIMIALPFPLYKAVKGNKLHLLTTVFMMVCLVMTKSRGGIILGFVELLICLVCMGMISENRIMKWSLVSVAALFSAAAVYVVIKSDILQNIHTLIPEDDARVQLVLRSFDGFADNPLFGQGIGNLANSDLYNGKAGTIPWYHMMIPQIIGSMGMLGVAAYLFEFYTRVHLTVKKFSPSVMTIALSYMGLLLMSQVNPGEFCPLPYGMIAVILFIVIENAPDTLVIDGKSSIDKERK